MACLLIKSKAPTPSTDSTRHHKRLAGSARAPLGRHGWKGRTGGGVWQPHFKRWGKLLRQGARNQPPEKVTNDDAPSASGRLAQGNNAPQAEC